jgi:hypothetical protein
MEKLWSPYVSVVVETYCAAGTRSIRVRPIPGEAFSSTMNVECSRSMRTQYRLGTRFRIRAKLTDKEGGKPFLYCRYDWKFEVLTSDARLNSSPIWRGSEQT